MTLVGDESKDAVILRQVLGMILAPATPGARLYHLETATMSVLTQAAKDQHYATRIKTLERIMKGLLRRAKVLETGMLLSISCMTNG